MDFVSLQKVADTYRNPLLDGLGEARWLDSSGGCSKRDVS